MICDIRIIWDDLTWLGLIETLNNVIKYSSLPSEERYWYWHQHLKHNIRLTQIKTHHVVCLLPQVSGKDVSEDVSYLHFLFPFFQTDLWHVCQPLQQLDLRTLCAYLQADRLRKRPTTQRAAVLGKHDGAFWYWTVCEWPMKCCLTTLWCSEEILFLCLLCLLFVSQDSHSTTLLQRSSASRGSLASNCMACCTNHTTWSLALSIPPLSLFTVDHRFDLFHFQISFMLRRFRCYRTMEDLPFVNLINWMFSSRMIIT